MNPLFPTVTIIGTGLLGGSLGLAMKARGLATTVRGLGRNASTLEQAKAAGAIDEIHTDLTDAVIGSDLVVICTPAATVPDYLDKIRPLCARDMVVTDVASTKGEICSHAREAWADPYRFVGSHPMAGSEKWGPEHADADLYDGAVTLVEAMNDHDPAAHGKVVQLWESVGSRVISIDPDVHDAMVARTSHVPHIAAAAIAQLLKDKPDAKPFVGKGFQDTTRIAEGRAELWRDICLTNPDAILEGLDDIIGQLEGVKQAIAEKNAAHLDEFFDAGQSARRKALES
ncbi:MAG: prephenate dehydrogenase [Candidatus Hydrogenedentota bacterium]|nr:MAG: prephenate dehydrogenase [Candidatus Hydrogenedentota bacterium]